MIKHGVERTLMRFEGEELEAIKSKIRENLSQS